MRFAAAVSEHPVPSFAVGEVVGQILESIGPNPSTAILFVTAPHAGAMEDIARAVRSLLEPGVLIGATAVSVVGGARELEQRAAITLWAAADIVAEPVRLDAVNTADGPTILGLPSLVHDGEHDSTLIVLADPFTFPADQLGPSVGSLPVIGGLASAAVGPGGNRLVLDDHIFTDGGVALAVRHPTTITPIVSQGCRPIGDPFVVTAAERQMVQELGGQPALTRLRSIVEELSPEDRLLANQGLHVGHVINEHQEEFRRGDFLIRGVLGADKDSGAVAVGDQVSVGSTLQFQVRDAASADEDLRELLSEAEGEAALVFTCTGRGSHLFEENDHDAALVSDLLDTTAVGGMFCAGEIGPVGNRTFLHGFTASIAVFG